MNTCTAHVCHEPQSLLHIFTHQIHTDTSQACAPTCHTACTYMYIPPMLHTICIHTSHASTAHTNMYIHTYHVSVHTYMYMHTYHAIPHPLKCSSKYMCMHTPWTPPSNTSCLHTQTQDIHTNNPIYHVSPTLSLPPGPLESPIVLNSPLRQVTWEKRVANKGAI